MNVNKECAKEVKYEGNLDSIIEYLINKRNNNENVYIDYESINGVIRLYSCDIDYDNAYLRVYGLTKEEKNKYVKEDDNKINNAAEIYFDKLRDTAEKLELDGYSLIDVIDKLYECKKLNKNVYVDYRSSENDTPIRFYSMDLNIDDAFVRVMGITKEQFNKSKNRLKNNESVKVITDYHHTI